MEQYDTPKTGYFSQSQLIVDMDVIADNIESLCREAGDAMVIPAVKGDAYGFGMVPVAKLCEANPKIKMLAVAHFEEAQQLRRGGIELPVLILTGVFPEQCASCIEQGFIPGTGRKEILPALAEAAEKQGKRADFFLEVDTGLGRNGIDPETELDDVIELLLNNRETLHLAGTYSHFANAEQEYSEETYRQFELFKAVLDRLTAAGIDPGIRSISNSAASEWFTEARLDAVRLGRRLYFDSPTNPNGTVHEAASWRTRVARVRSFRAGTRIGYGKGAVLTRDSRVALVNVGYGDGLRQDMVAAHAPVLIGGKRVPILAMGMDQCFVDVTDTECAAGDEATMFGYDGRGNFLSAQEAASYVGDEGCGLTVMLMPRVERIYVSKR